MPRTRSLFIYVLWSLALVTLFAVFIGVKRDAALVAALSAAGTVAAAGFAAFAAMGSMRAAAESAAAARRSREAVARTARPRVYPELTVVDGVPAGRVQCGAGRPAADLMVVWQLKKGGTVVERSARLEPGSALDVDLPAGGDPWEETEFVWIEYWDDARIGHWRDNWQAEADDARFRQVDSELVD